MEDEKKKMGEWLHNYVEERKVRRGGGEEDEEDEERKVRGG